MLYLGEMRKETMKEIKRASVWVNKKSGTTHMVWPDLDYNGDLKVHTSTLNLRWERDYFFRAKDMDRFRKNYEFVCDTADNDFFVNVLANKELKSDYTWGLKTNGRIGISKDEFFNKLMGEN